MSIVQNKGCVTVCLLNGCALRVTWSSFSLTRPPLPLGVENSGWAWPASSCAESLLWSSGLTLTPSFSNHSQPNTCTWGNFLNAKLQPYFNYPFLKKNCQVTLVTDFDVYKFFSHSLKKEKNMYISLGFTSINGLNTDIAYGFSYFNPDKIFSSSLILFALSPFSTSTHSFSWEGHFSVHK